MVHGNQVYNSNSGNVGVGTSSPSNKFSVVGNADFDGNVGIGTPSPVNKLSVIGNTNFNGNVGIGTPSPTAQLHTTGSVRHEDLGGVGIRPVFANGSGNLEAFREVANVVNSTQQNIPDNSCTGASSLIALSGLTTSVASNTISVKINITHSYLADLAVYLQAPDGSIINLAFFNGSSGQNYTNTVFNDIATFILPSGSSIGQPFTGTYKPRGDMGIICFLTPTTATFGAIGGGTINPNGNWTLKVFDFASGDIGVLNNWSISMNNIQAGTNNYVPKWSNSSLSKTSLIYDNGTNVGIGTTTPSNKLTVFGNANITGNTGIGTIYPNAPLQFANTNANRKIVLYEDANNDHYFYGFGVEPGILRYQAGNNGGSYGGSHVFYSGKNLIGPSSIEVFRITGNGYVGIGTSTPHASLQFNSSSANRKIVLSEQADNDNQFYGFGVDNSGLRYQVGVTGASHVFYAGNSSSASNELMRIQGNGRVGIGITNPNASLSVARGSGNDGTAAFFGTTNTSHFNYSINEDTYIRGGKAGSKVIINDITGGKVGIGTANPDAPLHVAGSGSYLNYGTTPYMDYLINGSNPLFFPYQTFNVQVHANGWIWADGGGFVTTSDARIKNIFGKTNTCEDLQRLNQIEITNYKYIDVIANGSRDQKKVIAQQVQTVYPDAINTRQGIIPNVFEIAKKITILNNTTQIETAKPHDFKTGDIVKLIAEKGEEKTIEVLVIDEHTFTVAEVITGKVFVHGKKVNDLLSVDYDALSMLNVSATQELSKQVEQLKMENELLKKSQQQLQLENRNFINLQATLQSQLNILETKFNSILLNAVTSNK